MTLFGIQALVLFYWHLVLILCYMYSPAPNLMLYRPCGLYCLENRKINIAWGGGGREKCFKDARKSNFTAKCLNTFVNHYRRPDSRDGWKKCRNTSIIAREDSRPGRRIRKVINSSARSQSSIKTIALSSPSCTDMLCSVTSVTKENYNFSSLELSAKTSFTNLILWGQELESNIFHHWQNIFSLLGNEL